MSDPERLLDRAGSLEARLLSAALDEPPPPDLLARTLATVGTAAPTSAASVVAAKAAGGGIAGGGGGILGAISIGALTGMLTVGAYELAASSPLESSARPPVLVESTRESAAPPAVTGCPVPPSPSPVAPPSSPPSPPSSPHPSTLAAELEMLDEARSALRSGDPVRARVLLDRYAREIPRGQMAREAALLRAEATQTAQRTNP